MAFALAALALVGCGKKETITISPNELWFPDAAGYKTLEITSDCNWSVSIDNGADWFTVSLMSGGVVDKGTITVTVQQAPDENLRSGSFTIKSAKGKATAKVNVMQNYLFISKDELWFADPADSQSIELTADCDWTVSIDDNANWYTVSPMSGGKVSHSRLTVSVQDYDGNEFRSSSFTISSTDGSTKVRVRISQNVVEFEDITNMIFGTSNIEHWNTDYYGMLIEDSYVQVQFNPFDTASAYIMYFLEDGTGVQRDNHGDSTVYYPFTYEYNLANRNLHLEFETIEEAEMEVYDVTVLTASETVFRFQHEFKAHSWELSCMKKIGVIEPEERSALKRAVSKRKGGGPIFRF